MSFVLGSGSPRRRELLEPILGAGNIQVRPPTGEEAGFDGLDDEHSIRERLIQIVRTKMDNVQQQLVEKPVPGARRPCCLTADTIVVAEAAQTGKVVLGKPREVDWQEEVRDWMLQLYSGTTHEVWTGYRVEVEGQSYDEIITTQVEFCELSPDMVEWYLATEESIGKAGGYAIQGAAGAFVTSIQGSLTNIIGLPVVEVISAMQILGVPLSGAQGSY